MMSFHLDLPDPDGLNGDELDELLDYDDFLEDDGDVEDGLGDVENDDLDEVKDDSLDQDDSLDIVEKAELARVS